MKKWVAALRSGQYTQGKEMLRKGDTYCCLGVLCDLSKKGKWKINNTNNTSFSFESSNLKRLGRLSPAVMIWAGMKNEYGTLKFKKGVLNLATLNDDRKRSFKQIAAFIERNYKKL